jgi:hypothetical protein
MERVGDNRRDMREVLRRPEGIRKTFYVHLRQLVRAYLGTPSKSGPGEEADHETLIRKISFVHLKNTGGAARIDDAEIMEATRERQEELVQQVGWIAPSDVAVAGSAAQKAFNRYLLGRIKGLAPGAGVYGILHPSWRYGSSDEYYRRVRAQIDSGPQTPQDPPYPEPPKPTPAPPRVSAPQLADWRRRIIRLLNALDPTSAQSQDEGVAAWISRLSRARAIPRPIAAFMRIITEMRNVTEYEGKLLSAAESAAAEAAWAAIQEWADSRGLSRITS